MSISTRPTSSHTQQMAENVQRKPLVTAPTSMAAPTRTFGSNVTNTLQSQQAINAALNKKRAAPQLVASVSNGLMGLSKPAAFTTQQSVKLNKPVTIQQSSSLYTNAVPQLPVDALDEMLIDDNDDNAMRVDGSTPRRVPHKPRTNEFTLVRMPSELHFNTIAPNPQYVEDWIGEIVPNMKRQEQLRRVANNYMTKQTDISSRMREILVDWLIEVHLKFKLQPETLYLTVNLVDRFLEHKVINRTKLQLIGCTAMLLASKYEEVYAPEIMDFVAISDKAYTRDQILAMECIMLSVLNFNMTHTSPLRFAERFSRVATLNQYSNETQEQVEFMTKYLIELTLQNYHIHLNYLPSQVAASALTIALASCTDSKQCWSNELTSESEYTVQSLRQCIDELFEVASVDNSKYRAARKKFSHRKFGEVSKMALRHPFSSQN